MMIFNKWGVNAAFMLLLAKVIISLIPAVRIIVSVSFPPRTFPLQFRHICAVGEGLGGGGGGGGASHIQGNPGTFNDPCSP